MTPREQVLQHEATIALAHQNSAMDAMAAARARAAAADKVRERSREVRFGVPEPESSTIDRLFSRFRRRDDEARSSPRGPAPSK